MFPNSDFFFLSLSSAHPKAAICAKPTFLGQVTLSHENSLYRSLLLTWPYFCDAIFSLLVVASLGVHSMLLYVLYHTDAEPDMMSLSPADGHLLFQGKEII